MTSPADNLREAAVDAMPGWVDRSIRKVLANQSLEVTPAIEDEIQQAGSSAQSWVAELIGPVLMSDDPQHVGTPLTIVRSAARFPTEVLRAAGAQPLQRDEFAQKHFPDDAFDLTPAAWADIDEALVDPAIRWGASRVKAHFDQRSQ